MKHVRLEMGGLRFSGACSSCWKACHATCCRTMAIPLTAEEIASGLYETMEVRGVTILKRNDDGCIYLKGTRCSRYEDRPSACRAFDCSKFVWRILPVGAPRIDAPEHDPALREA